MKDKAIKSVMKYLNSKSEAGFLAFKARQKASVQQLKAALVQQEAARIIRKTAIATMKTAILTRQVVIIGEEREDEEEDRSLARAESESKPPPPGPELDWTSTCRACALPLEELSGLTVEVHGFKYHEKCMVCSHSSCAKHLLDPLACYVDPASGGGSLLCKRHMIDACGKAMCPG